jgi:hypothetical protein
MSFSTSADNSQATRSATRVPPDEVCTKREAALRRWRGQDEAITASSMNEVDGGIVP